MNLYVAKGSPDLEVSFPELQSLLFEAPAKLGECRHAFAVPTDLTRRHSRAGELTRYAYDYYGSRLKPYQPVPRSFDS